MAYADYQGRQHHLQRPRPEPYSTTTRDTDAYPVTAMHSRRGHSPPYRARNDSYQPRAPPRPPQYYPPRPRARKPTWPPPPSVQDAGDDEGEPPLHTRGTVDQESLLDDVEPPPVPPVPPGTFPTFPTFPTSPSDRRFVLVSEPSTDDDAPATSSIRRDRRRGSVAERGNMPHIKTDLQDAPVFTERQPTPYAFTRPQREPTAPSPAAFSRSPEPRTPAHTLSRVAASSDTVVDADLEPADTTHLRTERKPARYSFVKSDLQREPVRVHTRPPRTTPEPPRRESAQRPSPKGRSPASPQSRPYARSPPSSSSSLDGAPSESRSAPLDPGHPTSSQPTSRPASPLHQAPSPKLPIHLHHSPPGSRPSSRGNMRAASPLSFSTTLQPPSLGRMPVAAADWHATYPPSLAMDQLRPSSRGGRSGTMPPSTSQIDLQSPSLASKPSPSTTALPYPIDDRPSQFSMPPEEHYQYEHSTTPSPQQPYPRSPRISSPSIADSARVGGPATHATRQRPTTNETLSRTRRVRSNSVGSSVSQESYREPTRKNLLPMDLDKPLPSCPRDAPSGHFDDWYSLQDHENFDICPSCFKGVLADTPFAVYFAQRRLYERPVERICDFSSPWVRLAWLLTVQQRRQSLDLLYALADITEEDRPCPGDRKLGADRITWYGIPDQRDGVLVANFAVCLCDKRMVEALLPSLRGYFIKMPLGYQYSPPDSYLCSLRTSSRRSLKYLDVLVELDAEAQSLGQLPNIDRFIQLARENAFKGECGRDKISFRKPWHFIPSLPEFTVCEECYKELIWPAIQTKTSRSSIPRLFNRSIQLAPEESHDTGSSCCLYSPRMRRIWETSIVENDMSYLERKATDRKNVETRLARERQAIMRWMVGAERESSRWEHAKSELKDLEKEWASWE